MQSRRYRASQSDETEGKKYNKRGRDDRSSNESYEELNGLSSLPSEMSERVGAKAPPPLNPYLDRLKEYDDVQPTRPAKKTRESVYALNTTISKMSLSEKRGSNP